MEGSAQGKLALHWKILIGLAIGSALGLVARSTVAPDVLKKVIDDWTQPLGTLFMRMIFMVVIPLLFSALVLGVMELGNSRRIGRVGLRTLGFTVGLSGIAVFLAIAGTNLIKPGAGVSEQRRDELVQLYGNKEKAEETIAKAKEAKGFGQTILEFIPENPVEEAGKPKLGGVLAFMVFALLFGAALSSIEAEKSLPIVAFMEGLFAVSQKLIGYGMALAPIGVAALMFGSVAQLSWEAFAAVAQYGLLVIALLAIHMFGTYSLFLKFFAKRNPMEFFRQVKEVTFTAFATSSSNATLPTALRVTEENVGIPKQIGNFVLTIGATANQNGTALFEGVTVLFLARLWGVDLTVADQITVMGMAILAGVGTAGVPGGSWPMIAAILMKVHVEPMAIALCFGFDRILDMSRTVVNVIGDITIAACVANEEVPNMVPELG